MTVTSARAALAAALLVGIAAAPTARAQEFDWKAHDGATITFLANTNPIGNLIADSAAEFTELTGITVTVDPYQEQQMRQRLLTVMNAQSDEVDVFMTLPSREGKQFAASGWYTDLRPFVAGMVAPDYDAAGLSPALVAASTFDGALTGIPLNIEGPLLYVRKDILEECGVALPQGLDQIGPAAARLQECQPSMSPFATRGLAPALPYTFSNVLHNMGGSYMVDGRSALCSAEGRAAIELYAGLLRDYGPPGSINNSFQQLSALYRGGRTAMSFQSSNEFATVMEGGERLDDTVIVPLPEGPGGSHPTTIGWSLAVSGFSSSPEPAWLFVQWITLPQMQAKFALAGIAPPRAAVAQDPAYQAWLDEQPLRGEWQEALNVLAETGTSEVGYPIIQNPQSREIIGQAVGSVLLGTATADEACATADAAMDQLIAAE